MVGSNILEGSLGIPVDSPGVVEGTGMSIPAHSAWLGVSNTNLGLHIARRGNGRLGLGRVRSQPGDLRKEQRIVEGTHLLGSLVAAEL